MRPSTYKIFDATTSEWLQDDESTWSDDFDAAAEFTDSELADDIRVRETRTDGVRHVTIVMGLME